MCAVVTAGLGVAGVVRLRGPGRTRVSAGLAAPVDVDLAELAAEVSSLRRTVNTLRAQQRPAPDTGSPAASSCDPGGKAPESGDPLLALAQAHEVALSEGRRLDDRLVAETRDATWAPQYEQTLRGATASSLSDPGTESLAKADCRSTLCRLEVRHPDGAHGDSFQSRFRIALPDAVYRVSQVQNDDHSYSSVFHILRSGQHIPQDPTAAL